MMKKGIQSDVGSLIKTLRKQRQYSLSDIAKKTNIAISSLSAFENGDKLPDLPKLIDIAKALDCPPELFLLICIRNKTNYVLEKRSDELGILLKTFGLNLAKIHMAQLRSDDLKSEFELEAVIANYNTISEKKQNKKKQENKDTTSPN